MQRLQDLDNCVEIAQVIDYLDEVMGITPQSKIQITHDYPHGWHATVGADNFALIIGHRNDGYMRMIFTAPCYGFYPTGNMRLLGVDEAIYELHDFYEDDNERHKGYWSPINCMGNACNSTGANCVMCNAVKQEGE